MHCPLWIQSPDNPCTKPKAISDAPWEWLGQQLCIAMHEPGCPYRLCDCIPLVRYQDQLFLALLLFKTNGIFVVSGHNALWLLGCRT